MTVAVVVGNPKARSRTLQAACLVAEKLSDRPADVVIDLVELGAALLDWSSPEVAATVAEVASSDLVVVASPTYKATFTGLLKLFLDRVGTGALAGRGRRACDAGWRPPPCLGAGGLLEAGPGGAGRQLPHCRLVPGRDRLPGFGGAGPLGGAVTSVGGGLVGAQPGGPAR